MSKISFKNESRHIPGFQLNKIETLGKFQDIGQNNETKQSRNDMIDQYYTELNDIKNNRTGSTIRPNRKILEPDIIKIYKDITGNIKKPGMRKNDMIDAIEDFYKNKYVPRHSKDINNINISIEDNKADLIKHNYDTDSDYSDNGF